MDSVVQSTVNPDPVDVAGTTRPGTVRPGSLWPTSRRPTRCARIAAAAASGCPARMASTTTACVRRRCRRSTRGAFGGRGPQQAGGLAQALTMSRARWLPGPLQDQIMQPQVRAHELVLAAGFGRRAHQCAFGLQGVSQPSCAPAARRTAGSSRARRTAKMSAMSDAQGPDPGILTRLEGDQPTTSSRHSLSRTGVRETPRDAASWWTRIPHPGFIRPSSMATRTAATACSTRRPPTGPAVRVRGPCAHGRTVACRVCSMLPVSDTDNLRRRLLQAGWPTSAATAPPAPCTRRTLPCIASHRC